MSRDLKYSLAMIARNCADDLSKALSSFSSFPDEIVVVNTALDKNEDGYEATNEAAREFGAKIFDFPWVNDFSKARQVSFDHCTNDIVMWLDTDDVVRHPDRLDKNIRTAFDGGASCLFVEYLYEWDEFNNCTTRLVRERIVDRRIFEWRAPIHECLCANWQHQGTALPEPGGSIIHSQKRYDTAPILKKLERNLGVFEEHWKSENPELRMLFYWGNTLLGLHRTEEAIEKYKEYIERDRTNVPQICVARVALSECHRNIGRYSESLHYAHGAIALNPALPSPWLQCAETYMMMNQFDRAIEHAEEAHRRVDGLRGEMVSNPTAVHGRPFFVKAYCFANMGQFDKAKENAEQALKFWPEHEEMGKVLQQVFDAERRQRLVGGFIELCNELKSEGAENGQISSLAKALPKSLMCEPDVNRFLPKDRDEEKLSIAFLCPGGPENWGPDSIGKGIGGSEEAVINMSREFSELGWEVEVYCQRLEQDFIDGVMWYPHHRWTGENDNPLDVSIFWRMPSLPFDLGTSSRLRYLWLHDMPIPGSWRLNQWNLYDGIMLLSPFHREQYPWIPDEKVLLSQNGMDHRLFCDELENVPTRMIWGSDPQRGLEHVLAEWPKIKQAVPEAELHVFYGWSPLFHEHAKSDPSKQAFKKHVDELAKAPGVFWRGRVGQDELNKEYARAGVWGYPTEFPEISCITAMKAQAHGAIPVCTDEFALRHTVQAGLKLPGPMNEQSNLDRWRQAVIDVMTNPEKYEELRKRGIAWARGETWAKVARQWEKEFKEKLACRPKSLRLERGNQKQLAEILSA